MAPGLLISLLQQNVDKDLYGHLSRTMTLPPKSAKFLAGLGPLSILRMLWKRKLVIILLWTLISGIAVVVAWRLPAVFSAEALILVDSQKIPEKYVSSTVSTDVQDRLATISQQILSSSRLKKIIDDFDLYKEQKKKDVQEEILDMMRKDISIKVDKGWTGNRPGAFRIGYKGPDPAIVAQVANRVANLYIEENLKTREVQAEGTSEFIDTQLEEAKKRLDELEAAVSDYKLKHNGELPQQESSISGTLSRLQIELQSNRDALGRAQESKMVLENTLKVAELTMTALSAPELPGTEDAPKPGLPAVSGSRPVKLSEQISTQIAVLRLRGYAEIHPDMKKLNAELIQAQKLESQSAPAEEPRPAPPKTEQAPAKAAEVPRPPAPRAVTPRQAVELGQALERVTALKSNIAIVVKEIEQRTADQQVILRDINGALSRLQRLPIHEQELAKITRDYEISKANYRSLLDKKFSAEMATDMEHRQKSERFTVIDPARVPEKPISPNRPLLGGGGMLLGLVIGLAFGVGAELRKNVVLGEWELPAGVPVLGRLPYILPIVAEPDQPGGKIGRMVRSRRFRVAIISSAVLSCLVIAAAGIYFLRTRS
jgi:polysaccharide chain length determinant protein (PEP-CTERM system associated)